MKDLSLLVWLTQLGLSVALPLAGFVVLALWLRDSCGWGNWVIWAGVALGIFCAIDGFRVSLKAMKRLSDKKEKDPPMYPLTITTEGVTMDSRKLVFKETGIIALGELVCSGLMVGVFAALGYFSMPVLWGALFGSLAMTANYFFMAVTVTLAADRAAKGQVDNAKKSVQLSSTVRLICLGAALVLAIKLGANPIATILPLAFARPILMLAEFFRKKGD